MLIVNYIFLESLSIFWKQGSEEFPPAVETLLDEVNH